MHAPVAEFIVKGKAHKHNEFGVKVNITVTNRRNFVVGRMVLSGNPYDGHTLKRALEQMRRLSQKQIDEIIVDRGYSGHGESLSRIYISGQKHGITIRRLERSLKRRQAIELVISLLKSDDLLGRNYVKGMLGDQINVLLCCAGHNLRLVLKRLKYFSLEYLAQIWQWIQCLRSLGRRIGELEFSRQCVDDGSMELLPLQQFQTVV